jgi:1-aminocyclopropane-1-carboxylate deaminase/D-cysteine desulfhydrase-like pyridoxal-dependent ACC family enzyme
MTEHLPILRRYPALARLPYVELCRLPTPVMHATALAPWLWIKRDDLSADPVGGNKVRSLEFLLGGVGAGDAVVTVGAEGSTHALSLAVHGRRLGAHVTVARWRQELNPSARRVSTQIERCASSASIYRTVAGAFLVGTLERIRGARWIPAGGSSPLGVLGHVSAGLELAEQVEKGQLPRPARVVVPLGTGGTAAGLALGFRIAGLETRVIGVRVVPRLLGNRRRVVRLSNRTARLIESLTGERVPRVRSSEIEVTHTAYGGAYGRETAEGRDAADRLLRDTGIRVDATYSGKAAAVALAAGEGAPTLFWLTFDFRSLSPI